MKYAERFRDLLTEKGVRLVQTRFSVSDVITDITKKGGAGDQFLQEHYPKYKNGLQMSELHLDHLRTASFLVRIITGNSQLAAMTYFQNELPYWNRFLADFQQFLARTNIHEILTNHPLDIMTILMGAEVGRINLMTDTDREIVSADEKGSHIQDRFSRYVSLMSLLTGEEWIRAATIAELAGRNQDQRQAIITNAGLADTTIFRYPAPAAIVYKPIAELTYREFHTIAIAEVIKHLKGVVALYASEQSGWYEKIKGYTQNEWHLPLNVIKGKIEEILLEGESEDLEKLKVITENISINLKDLENAVIKARYEKDKREAIGEIFCPVKYLNTINDQIRLRLEIKDGFEYASVADLLIKILGEHKFKVVEEPHFSSSHTNGGKGQTFIVVFKAPDILTIDGESQFRIEAQIRPFNEREAWEHGEYAHLNKDVTRFRKAYGVPEDVSYSTEFLRRIRARAILMGTLCKRGKHCDVEPFLVPVVFRRLNGDTTEHLVTAYGDAIAADVISRLLDIGQNSFSFDIYGKTGVRDVRAKIEKRDRLIIEETESLIEPYNYYTRIAYLKELLCLAHSQSAQNQAAAALFELFYQQEKLDNPSEDPNSDK